MKCYQKSLLLVFSCLWFAPFLHAQEEVDVNDMNKRELRRFATQQIKTEDSLKQAINQFEQDIASKNAFIDQNRATIAELNAKLESAQTKTKELEQRLIGLEEKANNNALLLEESQKTNTGLNKQITILKDSISLLVKTQASLKETIATNQNKTEGSTAETISVSSSANDFLNQLYLGNVTLSNQDFVLIPKGIIGERGLERGKDDGYYNSNTVGTFYNTSGLTVCFQGEMKKTIPNVQILKDYKKLIEANVKFTPADQFFSKNANVLPQISFLKGKLMSLKSNGSSTDFLFSLSESSSENINTNGQKGYYFNLTDDNEKEHKLNLFVWQGEVYLVFTTTQWSALGLPDLTTGSFKSRVVRQQGLDGYKSEVGYNSDDYYINSWLREGNRNKRYNYYTVCDKNYIGFFTKVTPFQKSAYVKPEYIFCKLQTLE